MRRFVFLTMVALVMAVVLASPAWAATFTVDRSDDPDLSTTPTADDCTDAANDCSLRGAINAANSSSGVADTINFNLVSPATITLGSQLPTITDSAGLTINGGSANITVSGNNTVRVFEVGTSTISGAKLTLNNLTVANGRADNAGGGILNLGTLEVNNSTISGNRAGTDNGGIGNASAGTLTVNNSTISGNSANNNGGGIGNGSTATLNNTIVANNEGGNCAGLPVTDDGGNLEWPGNDCGFALSADPLLGPLTDNGGPTQTHALQPDSPAIDAAVECPPPATDQRGVSRPQGDACDIGSFELEKLDTEAPKVISTFPRNGGEVGPAVNVTATFSEDMQEASVINAFKLFRKGSTNQIAATVTYDAMTDIATLNPTNNLRRGVTYKAVVTTVAKDEAGNRLDQNDSRGGLQQKVWFFEIDN